MSGSNDLKARADKLLRRATRPLLAGLLIMLLLVGSGMAVGTYQLRQMARTLDSVVREETTAVAAIVTMMRTARERMVLINEALNTEDPFLRDEKLLEFDRLQGEFANARRGLLALPLSREEETLRGHQHQLLLQLLGHFDWIVTLARADELAAARDFLKADALPAQSRMLDTLARWVDIRHSLQGERAEQSRMRQRQAVGMMIGVGLIAVLVGGLVALVVYRWNARLIGRLGENEIRLRDALAEQAFQQRALDEHAIVSMADSEGRITYVNDKFCRVSGYSREELIGGNHRLIKSDFHPPEFFQTMWETISGGGIWRGEVKNRAKDGRHYWVETTTLPMLDENGLPMRYISVRTEITHIMELEEKVRQANLILQSSVIERTRELELAKGQLERELADRVRTQAELQASYDELKVLHRQLQETQQQLMQSEKLAAIGQLAAGMAHEINNPIGFVSSNLAMLGRYQDTLAALLDRYRQAESGLSRELREDLAGMREQADLDYLLEDTRDLLRESRDGIDRVRKIVRDLREFSQVDSLGQRQWVNLNQCLDSSLRMLGERVSATVAVHRDLGRLPPVECNLAEINQVFYNLLDNALRAMPAGGPLTLRSGGEDGAVFVEIEDGGDGIPDAVLPHIFDPFYTTRPVGQGRGLGLSMAYGAIQQHGGRISVRSQPGAGSIFRVTLPLRRDASDAQGAPLELAGLTA